MFDNIGSGSLHTGSKFSHADLIGNGNFDRLFLGDLQLKLLHSLLLFLTALRGVRLLLVLLFIVSDLLFAAAAEL